MVCVRVLPAQASILEEVGGWGWGVEILLEFLFGMTNLCYHK